MDDAAKTKSFLTAIENFAKLQRDQIHKEVEDYKNEQLKIARDKAEIEAQKLIDEGLAKKKSKIAAHLAKSEAQSRKELYMLRQQMINEIISEASEKLVQFSSSNDYKAFIQRSCDDIKGKFAGDTFVVYAKNEDIELVKGILNNAKVLCDSKIKIGGIKGYCESKALLLDDTLDSRLDAQRTVLIDTCGLKVV